jgi:hypothetical protein
MPLGQHRDPAAQVDRALFHDLAHAGMGGVGGAVDLGALERPVDRVLLADRDDSENLPALAIYQRRLRARADAIGQVLFSRERDRDRRDRPERAAGERHVEAGAAPVGFAHESRERRIGAHAEHEQIRDLAARQRDPGQGLGALARRRAFGLGQEQRPDPIRTVGHHQFRHVFSRLLPLLHIRAAAPDASPEAGQGPQESLKTRGVA